ncbi:MAG TPA: hypothetical protein VI895_09855 [Bdellovibrionota bacterium]|nr:hypothetical protein [Bdellovibrionota bacterium]
MTCPLNAKRVLIGGIVAGAWVFVVQAVAHMAILGERYQNLTRMGHYFAQPRIPYMPMSVVLSVLVGIMLAWLYAASRDTMSPGAVTAIKVGLIVGFLVGVPGNVAAVAWSTIGKFVPFVTCLAAFAECIGGTLIAGALYQPKPTSRT